MKDTIFSSLQETSHGFIVFDPSNVVLEDPYYGDLYQKAINEDSLHFVYSGKHANENALKFIAWRYMVSGTTARELLNKLEHSEQFWDEVSWFMDAEIDFDDCYNV